MTKQVIDSQTEIALEAAAFRALRSHLQARTDVQNIDMMNLAGFCRNCLSRWYQEAAAEQGLAMEQQAAREIVYGVPYEDWRAQHQREASEAQKVAFGVSHAASHKTREQDDG